MKRLLYLLLALLTATAAAAPPPNDNFAGAAVMTGKSWLASGTVHEAGSEPNEPVVSGFPNGATAWWRWTAVDTGQVRLRTWGSERPNVLAVYRGSSLETIRLINFASGHYGRGYSAEVSFDAVAGQTYQIQVLGTDYLSSTAVWGPVVTGRIQLGLAPALVSTFTPANDNFSSAAEMTGASGQLLVCNSRANSEPGEPLDMPDNLGNSVWVSWTAPSAGVWRLSARETDFDNEIAVYSGNAVNALTRLNYGDQDFSPLGGPDVGGGVVNFAATAGQTYRFQIVAAAIGGSDFGVCRLSLQPGVPPANDNFANALPLSGSMPVAEGWATFATREAGEPGDFGDESNSLWWTWTAPATGILAVVSYEGEAEPFTGASVGALTKLPYDVRSGTRNTLGGVTYFYPVTAGTPLRLRALPSTERVAFSARILQPPPNDDFANRAALSGAIANASVDLEPASWEQNEPGTDGFGPQSVWYKWVAPNAARYVIDSIGSPDFSRINVYTGTALTALTEVGEESIVSLAPSAGARVFLTTVTGTEYSIQLRRETVARGMAQLHIRPAAPPPNDNFAAAAVVTGSAWSVNGSNADGTGEDAEPLPPFQAPGIVGSIWWRWTAPSSGLVRVTAAGSSINTVLSVYTGSALNALTSVLNDQSSAWNSAGSGLFNAQAGTVYSIRILGQNNEEGAVRLSLMPAPAPPNDNFGSRLVLNGLGPIANGNVFGATLEAGEPNPGANGGRSLWYEWVAPASGTAIFKVTADRFDPVVGLYSGTAVNSLSALITSGGGASTATEQTFLSSYPVTSGTSYKLRVDGAPLTNGNFGVSVSMPAAPLNDAFASRIKLAGAALRTTGNNEGATREANEPAHAAIAATHSVWWEWTAPANGTVTIDTAGSVAQPRLAVYTGAALNSLTQIASDTIGAGETFAQVAFQAQQNTRYLIAIDSSSRSRGDIALNLVSAAAVSPNDSFSAPVVWNTDAAETVLDLRGATAEPGEPAHGGRPAARSLWWKWTPLTSRRANVWIETQGNSLLARYAVYRDGPLSSLELIAGGTSDVHFGRLQADVVAGESYRIVVDSPAVAADPGWVRLGITPVNGTMDSAFIITPDTGIIAANTTGAFTDEAGVAPATRRELWWAWTPEVCARMEWRAVSPSGPVTVSVLSPTAVTGFIVGTSQTVPGSAETITTFDAAADGLYFLKISTTSPGPVQVQLVSAPQQPPPSNDLPYRAIAMAGTSWSIPVTLGGETEGRQWWTWQATAAGVIEIKLDGLLAANDSIEAFANTDSARSAGAARTNGGPPVMRLASQPGTLWRISSSTSLRRLRAATLSMATASAGTLPPNDSWDAPQVLPASWNIVSGNIAFASCQPGEPDHSNSNGTGSAVTMPPGRSVWYDWTPSVSGPVNLLLESPAPLALRLYSGQQRAQWNLGETLAPGSSILSFYARSGQTYHLAVATRPPFETTGLFTLRFGGPVNDLLANAIVIPAAGGSSSMESRGATAEPGEPGFATNFELPRASLWWKWTASAAGSVWVDTLGSEYDTVLTVYGTDPPDNSTRIAENDNATNRPGVTASAVRFAATAGQTYIFRVCRKDPGDPSGLAKINLSLTAPPDPFQRWLASYPSLIGPLALETADPDNDGIPNIMELVFATSPLVANPHPSLVPSLTGTGWQVEAAFDRNALEALGGGTSLEIIWQASSNLTDWQGAPPASVVRREGRFAIERVTLTKSDPPFVRLMIRKAR